MIDGRRVLVVVPARGGSKGVPLKNIRPVHGVPLIALTAEFISRLENIDRAVVSTDHVEIARVAEESGLPAPFVRPQELSGDRVGDWDVLVHALREMERLDEVVYDLVIMLQPTSPLRKVEHVIGAIKCLLDHNYDSVWTVSPADKKYHPLKALRLSGTRLEYFDREAGQIIARQQLDQLYYRNGAAYVITRDCLLEQKNIKGDNSGAFVIDEPVVSIDTLDDFAIVENLLQQDGL